MTTAPGRDRGPGPLTPQETQLAEALVRRVDHTGRVLLTALDGYQPALPVGRVLQRGFDVSIQG